MKASLFCAARYIGAAPHDIWPLSGEYYSSDAGVRSMQTTFDQFRCADEFGFDWVTVAEHHYSGFSLTPNPMVMAGALSQNVRRAKIAVLGPTLPILNPVRVAEELAMLDTMSGGRVVAGMMRGTPNEYVTYNINPAESRERFAEALHLIRRAWTETRPFGWLGRYYQYRMISIWPRPVQQPHPPLYMSGSSPEAGEFAACNRIGIGFAFTTVPLAKSAVQHYRTCARELGIEHFDLMGEGAGAAGAMWLALASEAEIGSVVLAAPDGLPNEAFHEMKRPVLVLCGTKDQSDAVGRYRTLLPDCHFMFVYDANRDIGAERPEALAFIALEFFERRDLFLVSRESGMTFP